MSRPIKPAISILTWKSPRTLEETLISIKPIEKLFFEKYVICQEADPSEIEVAQRFGFTPIPIPENLGIQGGLEMCVSVARAEIVLVVENDCPYLGNETGSEKISSAIRALHEGILDIVQLHCMGSRPSKRFTKYWKSAVPPRRTIQGFLRPSDARSAWGEAIILDNFPKEGTSEICRIDRSLYRTFSHHRPWSNRPFLTTRTFFLDVVLAFAKGNPSSRTVNGKPDLEHAINCRKNRQWWRKSKFRVGMMLPGQFGHTRIERPSEDEKNREHSQLTHRR